MLVMGGLVVLKQHLLDHELIRLLRVSHENLDQVSRLKDDLVTKEQALTSLSRELQRKNRELQEVSFTDSLTGPWNRRYLRKFLRDAGQIMRERGQVRQSAPINADLEALLSSWWTSTRQERKRFLRPRRW